MWSPDTLDVYTRPLSSHLHGPTAMQPEWRLGKRLNICLNSQNDASTGTAGCELKDDLLRWKLQLQPHCLKLIKHYKWRSCSLQKLLCSVIRKGIWSCCTEFLYPGMLRLYFGCGCVKSTYGYDVNAVITVRVCAMRLQLEHHCTVMVPGVEQQKTITVSGLTWRVIINTETYVLCHIFTLG